MSSGPERDRNFGIRTLSGRGILSEVVDGERTNCSNRGRIRGPVGSFGRPRPHSGPLRTSARTAVGRRPEVRQSRVSPGRGQPPPTDGTPARLIHGRIRPFTKAVVPPDAPAWPREPRISRTFPGARRDFREEAPRCGKRNWPLPGLPDHGRERVFSGRARMQRL